jgi:DNA-binding MarR family transcriptional regulator
MPVHFLLRNANMPGVSDEDAERCAAAWRELLERHAITMCALERELGERHALGVSEFEVLERMVEDGEQGQRVQQLAAEVYLSQSALSRVVGRLERDGLVVREMCPTDRRGIYVSLTDAGRERYAAARATQRQVLAATLGGQLPKSPPLECLPEPRRRPGPGLLHR